MLTAVEAAVCVDNKEMMMRMGTRLDFQLLMLLGKSRDRLMEKVVMEKCWSYSYEQDSNSRNMLTTLYDFLLMSYCSELSVWFLCFKAPNSAVQ